MTQGLNIDEATGSHRDKDKRTRPPGRKCHYPGCTSVLSIYTRGHYCNAHEMLAVEDADPNKGGIPTPKSIVNKWEKIIKRSFLERMFAEGKTEKQIAKIIGAPSPCLIHYFAQKYCLYDRQPEGNSAPTPENAA